MENMYQHPETADEIKLYLYVIFHYVFSVNCSGDFRLLSLATFEKLTLMILT